MTGLSLVACGGSSSDGFEETGDLMADLHRNFGGEEADRGYDFAEPLWVPRDHVFVFDVITDGVDGINDALEIPMEHDYLHDFERFIRIFRDPELTREIRYMPDFDHEGEYTEWISVAPLMADFSIASDLDQEELSDGWGNAGQYFLVQYIDFETGEMFERPLVTVFNIETEIDGRPNVRFDLNDDGVAGLVWEPVEGATRYAIVTSWEAYTEGGQALEVTRLHAITSETYWYNNEGSTINSNFIIASPFDHLDHAFAEYMNSDDRRMSVEEFMGQEWEFRHAETEGGTEFHSFHIGVIALDDDEGLSAVSNLIDIRSVASQVPMMPAIYLNEGNFSRSTEGYLGIRGTFEKDVLAVPTHTWVITTDGMASRFLIDYDIDRAIGHGDLLRIPFRIEGTMFEGFAEIIDFNEDTFENELQALAERQEGLRPRTGGVLPQTPDFRRNTDDVRIPEARPMGEFTLQDVRRVGSPSPLTAYIALNMLNGESRIDLSQFPESADQHYVFEAWSEASLQNPLILGPRSAQIDWQNGYLLVSYDHDAEERARQQQAIMERVDEIIEEIIEPGMTDLEMQTAINDWLVENVEYDFPALENAEQNNFMHVDPYFYDTFTAYGILINGVGVCSGYADAFVLIADRVGLESVFVTGFMNGSLPHAWNRVNIDGNWYTLDVTNNGLEHFPNAFFNLTDAEASLVLTEDNRWISDSQLPRFVAHSDAPSEYYRYNDRFFSQNEIAEVIAEGITRDGYAIYRTDMWLTEQQFRDIAIEVIDILGVSDLQGGFYLGIIYLAEIDPTANTGQNTNDGSTRNRATSEEEQALEMARWYLDIMPLSYEEVALLLEMDGFTNSAISAAMRELNREVDWYEQAVESAFLFAFSAGQFTESELFDYLFRDALFTRSEANHAVDVILNAATSR